MTSNPKCGRVDQFNDIKMRVLWCLSGAEPDEEAERVAAASGQTELKHLHHLLVDRVHILRVELSVLHTQAIALAACSLATKLSTTSQEHTHNTYLVHVEKVHEVALKLLVVHVDVA